MKAFTKYQDFLVHHGRPGQRWGVKNGPPYPLGASNQKYKKMMKDRKGTVHEPFSEADISKAEWNKFKKMLAEEESRENISLMEADARAKLEKKNTKKALTASAVLTPIFPLLLITDISNAKLLADNRSAEKLEKALLKQIESNTRVDPKTGFRLKQKEMTIPQDVAMINPGFKTFNDSYKHNCTFCTTAYDMRRRGYDVMANKTPNDQMTGQFFQWYPKSKMVSITRSSNSNGDYLKEIQDEITKQGNGARGNFSVQWKGGAGGHSMAYEVVGDKFVVIDAQSNKIYKDKDLSRIIEHTDYATYIRLDNVDINPKMIKKAVRP